MVARQDKGLRCRAVGINPDTSQAPRWDDLERVFELPKTPTRERHEDSNPDP